MKILAVDTTTDLGGVAVGSDGVLEGAVLVRTPQRYSETLVPMLDFVLAQLKGTLEEIDLLVVATGPGSFTGVRIGLAVVKAIGQSRKILGLGLSTLEVLACCFAEYSQPVAPMLDAGRGQVYGAVYSWTDGQARVCVKEQVVRPESWLESIPGGPEPSVRRLRGSGLSGSDPKLSPGGFADRGAATVALSSDPACRGEGVVGRHRGRDSSQLHSALRCGTGEEGCLKREQRFSGWQ